jgi:hypothetical protein
LPTPLERKHWPKKRDPTRFQGLQKKITGLGMRQKGLEVKVEQSFEVVFRGKMIGRGVVEKLYLNI